MSAEHAIREAAKLATDDEFHREYEAWAAQLDATLPAREEQLPRPGEDLTTFNHLSGGFSDEG